MSKAQSRGNVKLYIRRAIIQLLTLALNRDVGAGGAFFQWITEENIGLRELLSLVIRRPRISVLTPVYNTDPDILNRCIDSVWRQAYRRWELCIVDDGSTKPHVRRVLRAWAGRDRRIRVRYSHKNEGIASTINKAARMATGQFIGVLDHDDELAPMALFEYARVIVRDRSVDCIYCDEDKIDLSGVHVDPWHKSDWNPDLLLSFNYIMHFMLLRKALFNRLGGVRRDCEGSQDYDLILRVSECTDRIHHIPQILYHWRKGSGSIASGPQAKPEIFDRGLKALADSLGRRGIDGVAEHAPDAWMGVFRVRRKIPAAPRLSIVIIAGEQSGWLGRALDQAIRFAPDHHAQILLCGEGTGRGERLAAGRAGDIRRIETAHGLPVPAILNRAVSHADGDYLLFLDDRVEIPGAESITALLEQVQRPEVGAAGGKLYHPDGRVEHAGVILGPFGLLGYAHRATPDTPGYAGLKSMICNYSAVMGMGMMTRRSVFEEAGGFDPVFSQAYWDVDYCLRLRERGYWITYTPYARFVHHVPVKSIPEMIVEPDAGRFKERWASMIASEPFFNPRFSRALEAFVVP